MLRLLALLVMHLQMLEQLVPAVRLDGYYVLSDLAGVPDLFARVGPVLRGLRPGAPRDPRIAELTPEPFCARTYRLLATAEERGADLAPALLDLSEDVRETRRETMRRSATKRRAAMLVPIIAILAPVLLLFVAAPLPYLITGWR